MSLSGSAIRGAFAVLLTCALACADADDGLLVRQGKIGFDPARIGDDGLYGPPDGRRAMELFSFDVLGQPIFHEGSAPPS